MESARSSAGGASPRPDSGAAPAADGKGGYLVTLDRHVVDRLAAMRGRGESYSDVVRRLART